MNKICEVTYKKWIDDYLECCIDNRIEEKTKRTILKLNRWITICLIFPIIIYFVYQYGKIMADNASFSSKLVMTILFSSPLVFAASMLSFIVLHSAVACFFADKLFPKKYSYYQISENNYYGKLSDIFDLKNEEIKNLLFQNNDKIVNSLKNNGYIESSSILEICNNIAKKNIDEIVLEKNNVKESLKEMNIINEELSPKDNLEMEKVEL